MVVIAPAMIGMLGFLGLVVDIGWGYYQHRNAQNAADAAALAAIQEIGNASGSCVAAALTASIDTLVTAYTQDNTGSQSSATWNYTDNNGAGSTSGALRAVTYAPFVIQRVNANTHRATLLGAAYTQGDSTDWSPGTSMPLVLSLTE